MKWSLLRKYNLCWCLSLRKTPSLTTRKLLQPRWSADNRFNSTTTDIDVLFIIILGISTREAVKAHSAHSLFSHNFSDILVSEIVILSIRPGKRRAIVIWPIDRNRGCKWALMYRVVNNNPSILILIFVFFVSHTEMSDTKTCSCAHSAQEKPRLARNKLVRTSDRI